MSILKTPATTSASAADLLALATVSETPAESVAPETSIASLPDLEPKGELFIGKSYRFPSVPCSFVLSNGHRIISHEEIYTTDLEDEIKELDAAVKVGNVFAA